MPHAQARRRSAAPAGAPSAAARPGLPIHIPFLLACPAALALVLGRVPLGQNADGLFGTVMSLQRLTLFYWGQSRFANLLPALAAPIRDPVANADAQLVARIVLGLAAPLLVCALGALCDPRASVLRATVIAALLFLATAPPRIIYEALTQASPFGTSFTLAGLSVLAFRAAAAGSHGRARWRAAGTVLAVLASLENVSLAMETAPLAVGLCLLARTRAAVEWALAGALALGATIAAMHVLAPAAAPSIGGFGRSLAGLRVYGGFLLSPAGSAFWIALALAVASHLPHRRAAGAGPRIAGDLVVVGTIAVSFFATALSNWVVLNNIHPRYLVPDYLMAAGLGGLALERIVRRIAPDGRRQEAAATAAAAVLLGLALVHGLPRAAGEDALIQADWRRMSATAASAVRTRHLDGVAGAYWDVWPVVFRRGDATPQTFGFAELGSARRRAIVRRLGAQGRLRIGCIEREGVDCASAIRTTIGAPVSVAATGEPALALDGGRRLTTLLVGPLPGR